MKKKIHLYSIYFQISQINLRCMCWFSASSLVFNGLTSSALIALITILLHLSVRINGHDDIKSYDCLKTILSLPSLDAVSGSIVQETQTCRTSLQYADGPQHPYDVSLRLYYVILIHLFNKSTNQLTPY